MTYLDNEDFFAQHKASKFNFDVVPLEDLRMSHEEYHRLIKLFTEHPEQCGGVPWLYNAEDASVRWRSIEDKEKWALAEQNKITEQPVRKIEL